MLKPGETVVDHYVVEQKLGQGGFSQTYLVRDRDLPNYPLCVAKCFTLDPNAEIELNTVRRLFKREAQVLSKLGEHPSIPRLLAYDGDCLCLIEEYMHGTSLLSDVQHQRYWSANAIVAMLQEVLVVLAFVHCHQIVHGDIKPSNLIRQPSNGKIALVDFGAATSLDEAAPETKFGTPGYIAPEQETGHPTFASDLYALGMTAIYLMSGIPPTHLKRDPKSKKLIWQPARSHTMDLKLIPILDHLTDPGRDRYGQATEVLADLELVEPVPHQDRLASPRLIRSVVTLQKQFKRLHRASRKLIKPQIIVAIAAIGAVAWYRYDVNGFTKLVAPALSQHLAIQNPLTLKHLHAVSTEQSIEQLVFTVNNQLIARSRNQITVWDAQTATPVKTFESRSSNWTKMSVSSDGTWLATVDQARRVTVWNLASKQIIQSFVEPRFVVSLAISPDRERIATIDDAGSHRIRRITSGEIVQSFTGEDAPETTMMFADPDQLTCVSSDNRLKVWNAESGQLKQVFAGHTDQVLLLQVNNGKLYSFGKDRVRVWGIDRAELLSVFTAESGGITAAQLLNDTQRLLTMNQSGKLQLWNLASGQLMQTIAEIKGTTALSANGLLASYDHDQLQIWQVN